MTIDRSAWMSGQNLVILGKTVVELFNSLASRTVLCTFVQYLIAVCSQPEPASDVISGWFVNKGVTRIPGKPETVLFTGFWFYKQETGIRIR